MSDRELMQQALDALEECMGWTHSDLTVMAADALRARLAQPDFIWTALSDKDAAELKAAIEAEGRKPNKQPEQEPVAWQSRMRPDWEEKGWTQWKDCTKEQANDYRKRSHLHDWVYEARALYTAPPQRECASQVHDRREWQGLTDEEMFNLWMKSPAETEKRFAFARAVEAKLREKNTS
jgi:hypothetical protein